MGALTLIPEIKKNLSIEERIELVLDLARRVELLDDLLRSAREKRGMGEAEVGLSVVDQSELVEMLTL